MRAQAVFSTSRRLTGHPWVGESPWSGTPASPIRRGRFVGLTEVPPGGCLQRLPSQAGKRGAALSPRARGRGGREAGRAPPRAGRGRAHGADLGALPAARWVRGRGGSSAGSRRTTGFGRRPRRPADGRVGGGAGPAAAVSRFCPHRASAMAASPGSGSANPRKFSEKIALHTQRQAEETRAFEQLMTDLTLSRVQFQKLQQLRLTQYHGGSLPNVSQLRSSASEFQPSFHQADNVRGTRHHGLVERPSRNRFHPLHRRSGDKPGRQFDGSAFGANYSSQPLDESWPRQQPPWKDEKHPGFRLTSALNRTNSDSALHTSALSTKPQDPYGGGGQSAWPAPYMGFCDGENNGHGEVASFPGPLKEENLLNVPKPVPKQLWETKEIQSLSGRPRSCDVGGGNAFPHNGQNLGLSPFLGTLNTGGSLPDLTNLHYSTPLPASLNTTDHLFGSMSVGNSVNNIPAAVTHLGIRSSSGLQSSRSNPSIQATLNKTVLSSSLNNHPQTSVPNASALHPSLRLFSLSNPSLSTTNLSGPSRRRQPPVSPLTLSPGPEAHQGFSRQLSSTSPLAPYPTSQMVSSDRSQLSFLPTEAQAQVSPPPPYPAPQELTQPLLQQPRTPEAPAQQPQAASSLPQSDFQLLPAQVPLVQQGSRELQDSFHLRPSPYSNCGSFPNTILTEDSSTSLFKDLNSALAGLPEVSLNVDTPFPLEEELQIEPLSLDGLNMLSDSSMGLLDPSVEETFRADRL
uniref:CREB regulated transcription coactivator 3 n=1 Tax=Macaca fascicularis TaxID=9541 RepID=A0A7N9CZI1_MACFA